MKLISSRSFLRSLSSFIIVTAIIILAVCIFPAMVALAHPAWGIVVDSRGQVYFSDLVTVWKIDSQGKLSVFRSGGESHVHDLNIDADGNLYGAENSYDPETKRFFSSTWKMTPSGGFSYLLAPTDNPPEGTSIWRDRDGNMFHFTNYPDRELLVLKRTPNGNVTALVESGNAIRDYRQGVPYSAGGTAFGADGALYFVNGSNIHKLTTKGTLATLVRDLKLDNASGNPAAGTQLFGIAVDAQDNAFVADYGNRRVLKITPNGQMTTVIRAEESWFPTGVAVKGAELYILEESHTPANKPTGTRVRKLSANGMVTVLATVGEHGVSSGPSAGETSSGSERTGALERNALYLLVGAGMGVVALTILVWRIRRRRWVAQLQKPDAPG